MSAFSKIHQKSWKDIALSFLVHHIKDMSVHKDDAPKFSLRAIVKNILPTNAETSQPSVGQRQMATMGWKLIFAAAPLFSGNVHIGSSPPSLRSELFVVCMCESYV